jgi:hypothetical protein
MTDHPERIAGVSSTVFSTARLFGGCTVNGRSYTYDPDTDTLVRDDVLKAEERAAILRRRAERMKKVLEHELQQGALFLEGEK